MENNHDLEAVIRSFEIKDKKYIEQITKYYKNLWKQNKN